MSDLSRTKFLSAMQVHGEHSLTPPVFTNIVNTGDIPHQTLQAHSPHQGCTWIPSTSLPTHGNSMALVESEPGLSLPAPWACCGEIQLTCNIYFWSVDHVGNYWPLSVWFCEEHPKLVQAPSMRNHQGGCAHSQNCKDGLERVREEFFSLWK